MNEPVGFSRSLYRRDALEAAAEAYAELTSIEIEETEADLLVRFSEDADREVRLGFGNHALFESIQRAKQEQESGED